MFKFDKIRHKMIEGLRSKREYQSEMVEVLYHFANAYEIKMIISSLN
jgi:hypothetical protein